MTQSGGRRPFFILLLIGLLAINCELVLLFHGGPASFHNLWDRVQLWNPCSKWWLCVCYLPWVLQSLLGSGQRRSQMTFRDFLVAAMSRIRSCLVLLIMIVLLDKELIRSGLFLPLVAWLCGGADLEVFNRSKVALAIGLPKSLGNMVAWVRTLSMMDSYSSKTTIWDP